MCSVRFANSLFHILSLFKFIDSSDLMTNRFLSFLPDKLKIIKLVELLVSRYVLPGSNIIEACSSEVLGSILGFLLCVLDVPTISGNLSTISPFYAPVFKLTNSR